MKANIYLKTLHQEGLQVLEITCSKAVVIEKQNLYFYSLLVMLGNITINTQKIKYSVRRFTATT